MGKYPISSLAIGLMLCKLFGKSTHHVPMLRLAF